MADVTLVGAGNVIRACRDILDGAGFSLHHAFDLEDGERCPVILGDIRGSHAVARQALELGRHVLVTNPLALPVERLSSLLEARRRAQAVFVWSDRRYHPGYRFVRSLVESDATWTPRFLRQESLWTGAATAGLRRWRAIESAALLQSLTKASPLSVQAKGTPNALRATADYLNLAISFEDLEAFVSMGLGEPLDRRETLIAAADRKVLVDELNESVPIRLLSEKPGATPPGARWVSYAAPSDEELVRQQCLAFLEAAAQTSLAQEEALLWQRALGVLQAMERSFQENGATVPVVVSEDHSSLRLIRSIPTSPSPAA
jgi:predicted dehydrogenase